MSTRIGINGFGRIGRQTLKAILERHVAPSGQVGGCDHHAAPRIERARRRDADADRIRPAIGASRLPHLDGQLTEPAHDIVDARLVVRRRGATPDDLQLGGDERRADLGAAEIDRQDRLVGGLVHDSQF